MFNFKSFRLWKECKQVILDALGDSFVIARNQIILIVVCIDCPTYQDVPVRSGGVVNYILPAYLTARDDSAS
jgi:hypothetical protein